MKALSRLLCIAFMTFYAGVLGTICTAFMFVSILSTVSALRFDDFSFLLLPVLSVPLSFLGFFIVFPAFPVVVFTFFLMDKYDVATKRKTILASLVLGILYSFILYFVNFSGTGKPLYICATIVGSVLSGWLYWRKMYTEPKGFQFI